MFKKNKSINRSVWNNKNLKIMAATNWTIISKHKETPNNSTKTANDGLFDDKKDQIQSRNINF